MKGKGVIFIQHRGRRSLHYSALEVCALCMFMGRLTTTGCEQRDFIVSTTMMTFQPTCQIKAFRAARSFTLVYADGATGRCGLSSPCAAKSFFLGTATLNVAVTMACSLIGTGRIAPSPPFVFLVCVSAQFEAVKAT